MSFTKEFNIKKINLTTFHKKLYDENNSIEILENVIQSVVWSCKLIDDETGFFEEVSAISHFQYPQNEFIPFDELTKSIILDWTENNYNVQYKISKIKTRLENKVKDRKKNIKPDIVFFDSLPN